MQIKKYLLTVLIFCSNFASGALMEDDEGFPVARTQSLTEAFLPEALIEAVKKGDLPFIIDYCQKNKFDIDLKSDSEGMTLLMYACLHNKPDVVEWLLKVGADFKFRHFVKGRAINIAADQGNLQIVKLLAEIDQPMRKNQYLLLLDVVNNKAFKAFEQKNMKEWEKYMKIAVYLHTINETGTTYEAIYKVFRARSIIDQMQADGQLPLPKVVADIVQGYL